MAQAGHAIGVDLGTSNTVAVVRWPDGRTRPLLFDGQPILPSAVYLDDQGRLHIGRDAQRLAQLDPTRYEPNPKRRIDESTVLLGDREGPVIGLLAAILQLIAEKARETCGLLPHAVLTYPASWGAARRGILQEAASQAGWPLVRLLPEPIGAARYFADALSHPLPDGGALAVFDFGGGTLDIAVVRNDGGALAVIGSGGAEDLGGLDFDAALVNHLGGLLATRHPAVWRQLSAPATPTDRRHRRLFWEDVRGAKEMLSRATVAPVPIPGVDDALHITREELERLARPLVARAVDETSAVIQRCQLASGQLSGVFLVGGASRIPLVAQMLHARLGFAPTALEQPELPVAEGALAELNPGAPSPVSPGVPSPVSPPGPPGPPAVRPWFRRPWVYAAAAGLVAVTLLGVSLLYVLGDGEEPFVDLTHVKTVGFEGTAYPAEIQDGRAYLAAESDGELSLTAVNLADGEVLWNKRLSADAWEDGITAHQKFVVAVEEHDDSSSTLHAFAPSGKKLLTRKLPYGAWHMVHEDRLIVGDPEQDTLVWIDVNGNKQAGQTEYTESLYPVDTWAAESGSAAHLEGYRFESPEPDQRMVA
ncbi:MAG: Hsp70 family protein, partial [Micromonosporaceae bacterium]|nr:Hsp70 family protein [Micromonosporaceae bacterium]